MSLVEFADQITKEEGDWPAEVKLILSALEAGETDLSTLVRLLEKLLASSILDLLDQVGTKDDELISLKNVAYFAGHSEKYLALRCKQGELFRCPSRQA